MIPYNCVKKIDMFLVLLLGDLICLSLFCLHLQKVLALLQSPNSLFLRVRIVFYSCHRDGLVSLFFWHINRCSLFNAEAILLEQQSWYYLTHSWEDKGVHTFPKGNFPEVNIIARLEYELAYYDSAVHRFNHYTTRTPLVI